MRKAFLLSGLFMFLTAACSPGDSVWKYDVNYTRDLILAHSSGYQGKGFSNSIKSVSMVQIYQVEDKKDYVLNLKSLKRQRLLGELRSNDNIRDFFESLQKIADRGSKGCSIDSANQTLHIVAYDTASMRLAYIRYYVYSADGIICGIIRPLGDEGIFYNRNLPSFLVKLLEERGGHPMFPFPHRR